MQNRKYKKNILFCSNLGITEQNMNLNTETQPATHSSTTCCAPTDIIMQETQEHNYNF